MSNHEHVPYRISKGSGRLMVLVGLAMDLIPMIIMIIVAAFLVASINDCVKAVVDGSNIITKAWKCGTTGAKAGVFMVIAPAIPILYSLAQVAVITSAMLLFPAWFYFGYRYSMLDVRFGKFLTNLTSFVVSVIIKVIPVINLLPFPSIALTVWRHVQYSRKEDREKAENNAPATHPTAEAYGTT